MASTPSIVFISKGKDITTVCYELRKRGFIVAHSSVDEDGKSMSFALEHSSKLLLNAMMRLRLPMWEFSELTSLQKHLVLHYTLDVLKSSKEDIGYEEAWVAHDKKLFSYIFTQKTPASRLEAIFHYFGPQISFYFAWLANYTQNLQLPAVVGLIVFLQQWYMKTIDTMLMPYYAILIALWGTYFLEFWKREGNSLSFQWKVMGVEDIEADEELAKAVAKEGNDKYIRLSLSYVGVASIIYFMLQVMLYYIDMHIRSEEIYGSSSWMRYYPLIVYSILPCMLPLLLEPLAQYLNQFEAHTSKSQTEEGMIYKRFALQFINRYSALLYVAFWRRDVEMLRGLLISLLTTGALINNGLELGSPYINIAVKYVTALFRKKTNDKKDSASAPANPPKDQATTIKVVAVEPVKSSSWFSGLFNFLAGKDSTSTGVEKETAKELLKREVELEGYAVDEDYLEMVLQFGYVTMFAVVFPLTPALAYLNNFFESKVDLTKLGQCKRPVVILRSTIGAWQNCLQFISFMAVLTNCYILAMTSSQLVYIVPSHFHSYLDSEHSRLIAMVALEHLLFGIKIIMMSMIDDVPKYVQEALVRERIAARQREVELKIAQYSKEDAMEEDLEDEDDDDDDDIDNTEEEAQAIKQLNQTISSPFSFNPLTVTALVAAPLVLQHSSLSPYLYVPLSVLFLSYYQNAKDRIDRKAAAGIVSDPRLITFVQEEMPSWVSDSEFQRMEWLNSILQTMWPQVTLAVEKLVSEQVQPILDKSRPTMLTELKLARCSLGSIAPKVMGVRYIHSSDSSVRLDVEIRYAGDPIISLKVGTLALPSLVIELAELHVSAIVRVELLELIPRMPCFTALSITCMKKPFVDFSLKVAGLDIMNLGAGEYNVMHLVRSTISNALASTLIFPKRIIVKMDKESEKDFSDAKPSAILMVKVEKATDLKAAYSYMGSMGSDPYIEIKSANQLVRTTTKSMTTSPVWDETFEIMIYDVSAQVVEFEVKDSEMAGPQTVLGTSSINVSTLKAGLKILKAMVLTTGDSSKHKSILHLSLNLQILVSNNKKKVDKKLSKRLGRGGGYATNAILYDLPPSDLTDQFLRNDSYLVSVDSELDLRKTFAQSHASTSPSPLSPQSLSPLPDRRSMMSRAATQDKTTHLTAESYSGVLTVSLIKARGLKPPSSISSWLDSSFRPFLVFSVGAKTQETKAQKNTTNPQFAEVFRFMISDLRDEGLLVKALEKNKLTSHAMLGKVTIRLWEEGIRKKDIEKEWPLESDTGMEGYVGFKLSWSESVN